MDKPELVLLLHGLGNSRLIMSALAQHLRRRGYGVLNLGYPSCRYSVLDLSTQIASILVEHCAKEKIEAVHIVGFSLGSQIARILINDHSGPIKFSRLVMIGPPNQGSRIARFLRNYLPTHRIWGPVFANLCELEVPNPSELVEIGIIAGGLGIKLGFNPFFKEDNDGLVTVKETHLRGAKHHKTVFAVHGTMPLQPNILRLTSKFLETGSF